MRNVDWLRAYVWFLLALCVLTALVRLAAASFFATTQAAKLADPRKRRLYSWGGWAAVLISPFILLWGFFGHISGLVWAMFGLGILNGADYILNSRYPDRASLTFLSRIFGALNAVAAVAIWFFVLRYPAVR